MGSSRSYPMNDLFDQYHERTKRPAPVGFAAGVMSRLAAQQVWKPSLGLVLGSSVGLAAAVAFIVTFMASENRTPPPPAASLFKGTSGEMLSFHP